VGVSPQQTAAIFQQAIPMNVAKYYYSEYWSLDTILSTKGLGNATILNPTFAPTFSLKGPIPTDHPKVIFPSGKPNLIPGASIVTYYASWLLKQAVEKAGSTDPQKVFNALLTQKYAGPFGTCAMDKARFMSCPTVFTEVKAGKVILRQFASPYSTTPTATYD